MAAPCSQKNRPETLVLKAMREHLRGVVGRPFLAIACSGGVDSMVLTQAVFEFLKTEPIISPSKIFIFHVNHRQHEASERNEEGVRLFCKDLGFSFQSETLEISAPQSEMKLRELRYQAFSRLIKKVRCSRPGVSDPKERLPILLQAHHADDDLETYFMRLLRGAHPSSIRGIQISRVVEGSKDDEASFELFRPFLNLPKNSLIESARFWKTPIFEDPTNALPITNRNIIRSEILPLFEKLNRNSNDHILSFFKELKNQNQYTEKLKSALEIHLSSSQKARLRKSHWETLFSSVKKAKLGDGVRRHVQFPGDVKIVVQKKTGVEIYSPSSTLIAKISLEEI